MSDSLFRQGAMTAARAQWRRNEGVVRRDRSTWTARDDRRLRLFARHQAQSGGLRGP